MARVSSIVAYLLQRVEEARFQQQQVSRYHRSIRVERGQVFEAGYQGLTTERAGGGFIELQNEIQGSLLGGSELFGEEEKGEDWKIGQDSGSIAFSGWCGVE